MTLLAISICAVSAALPGNASHAVGAALVSAAPSAVPTSTQGTDGMHCGNSAGAACWRLWQTSMCFMHGACDRTRSCAEHASHCCLNVQVVREAM
jgi:hypothetical protein